MIHECNIENTLPKYTLQAYIAITLHYYIIYLVALNNTLAQCNENSQKRTKIHINRSYERSYEGENGTTTNGENHIPMEIKNQSLFTRDVYTFQLE